MSKSGGELVVQALEVNGVERLFCVPGESYLPVLDALHDSPIKTTLCRQEGGAAMMAEAWGKHTGMPGICFVTRGPGATNAASGVHVAAQDSSPMILFVGQISTGLRHREAFQEVDYQRLFGGMAKWVAEIDHVDRIGEMISRAFHVAQNGRPGPVVLALPEDTLSARSDKILTRPASVTETAPPINQMQELQALLASAKRPIAILGGSRWSAEAVADFTRFAENHHLPAACSFRRQMLFDHLHPCYAGDVGLGINPKLRARIEQADLVLLAGGRMSEVPSQNYTLLDIPQPSQKFIHVHAGIEELGKTYNADVAIHATPIEFARACAELVPPADISWGAETEIAHADYLAWSTPDMSVPGAVQMPQVISWLRDHLPEDAIITNGAGNYAAWIHRFWRFRQFGTQVAPTSGSMGVGLPAAIAAKLASPQKSVVAFAGDGCFQMTSQEYGTAVQAGAAIIVLVFDNGIYGTIRMHQEMHFPGRISATDIVNPDFAEWARSFGTFATTVNNTDEFAPAFEAAESACAQTGLPALIHVITDPQAITPDRTLDEIAAAN